MAVEQGVLEEDCEGVVAYAHAQFKGLHEGNLIRYRLKPADIEDIDLE